jgi:hypothetical protein
MKIQTVNNGIIEKNSYELRQEAKLALTEKAKKTYLRLAELAELSENCTQASNPLPNYAEIAQFQRIKAENRTDIDWCLFIIQCIREASNPSRCAYAWLGINYKKFKKDQLLAILSLWENELTQNNYTHSAVDENDLCCYNIGKNPGEISNYFEFFED